MKNNNQLKVINVPRGHNIGYTVINSLTKEGIYNHIDIETIHTERDVNSKTNIVTLEYSFKK